MLSIDSLRGPALRLFTEQVEAGGPAFSRRQVGLQLQLFGRASSLHQGPS